MSDDVKAQDLVVLENAPHANYGSGFTANVVCEFRFPTLMELGEKRPPAAFVNALRKSYPILSQSDEVTITGAQTTTTHAHMLRANRGGWIVALKESSVSLESKSYPGFKHFRERIEQVVQAAGKIIDSDVFTRVGLRYINHIPVGGVELGGWVNPELVGPVLSGKFRQVANFDGRMALGAEDGGCLLQHAVRNNVDVSKIHYLIDIDCYRNEVDVKDALVAVDSLHAQAFEIFSWALGEHAKVKLQGKKG